MGYLIPSTSVDQEEQEKPERPKRKIVVSPFVRLSRVHAFSAAGDAMGVALAGSLFFNIDPSAARWRVGLYLALTIAPHSASPLIGPIIDRCAGRRSHDLRVNLPSNRRRSYGYRFDSLFLFPLAFAILILRKVT